MGGRPCSCPTSTVSFLPAVTLRRLANFERARADKARQKSTRACWRSGVAKTSPAIVIPSMTLKCFHYSAQSFLFNVNTSLSLLHTNARKRHVRTSRLTCDSYTNQHSCAVPHNLIQRRVFRTFTCVGGRSRHSKYHEVCRYDQAALAFE